MNAQKDKKKLYIRILWALFWTPVIFIIIIFILISQGKFGYLPEFKELENPQNNLASEIYSADSALIGKFFIENRTYVDYSSLSPYLKNALLATEDIRFYKHSGVDARGLARVLFRTVLGGQDAGGGSTITQQLAKNLFSREKKGKTKIGRTINLVITKLKEWNTAVRLEKYYTKNEIMVMYLNTVSFGMEAYGIQSASGIFFNTTPDSLKLEESAVLVGLLRAPTYYSPVLNPDNSLRRRNLVLSQMQKYGFISPEVKDSVQQLPLNVHFSAQTHMTGMATHFRTYLRLLLTAKKPTRDRYYSYASFVEDSVQWERDPLFGWANKNYKPDGTNYNIYTDGLKIYTAINSKMQNYAEEAVREHLGGKLQKEFFENQKRNPRAPFSDDLNRQQIKDIMMQAMRRTERYRKLRSNGVEKEEIMKIFETPVEMSVFSWQGSRDTVMSPMDSLRYYKYIFRAGFMAMEPSSGHVKAYVGGHNYRYFQYDHVKVGKRQVGSTFKPFVYATAIREGYSPCYEIPKVPTTFHKGTFNLLEDYTPQDPDRDYGYMVSLKWGLANSVNTVTAWVMKQFGPEAIIQLARDLGIKSEMEPVVSQCFGVADLSLLEITSANATFANMGVHIEPIYVLRIEDKNGNTIFNMQPETSEAMDAKTAYTMLSLMEGTVDGVYNAHQDKTMGTAIRLRMDLPSREYDGFNSDIEIAGKTGTTQNQSDGWFIGLTPDLVTGVWVGAEDRSVHFRTLTLGMGTNMALPIWGYYMKDVYADSTLTIGQDGFEKPEGITVELDCESYGKKQRIFDGSEQLNW